VARRWSCTASTGLASTRTPRKEALAGWRVGQTSAAAWAPGCVRGRAAHGRGSLVLLMWCRYLHGLWVGQASANSDFAAIIWQLKLLGFNAIRLPFLFGDLATPAEQIGGAQGVVCRQACHGGMLSRACMCKRQQQQQHSSCARAGPLVCIPRKQATARTRAAWRSWRSAPSTPSTVAASARPHPCLRCRCRA
jgi:hypothetical protein